MKLTLTLFFGAFLLTAAAQSGDQKEVISALDQFNAAAKAGDRATLDKLLSPDLFYVHSSAKDENKQECIDALVKGKPDFKVEPGPKVNVYGKTAVVHGKMLANTATGKTHLDFVQVWVKNGKSWQMVGRHTVKLPS